MCVRRASCRDKFRRNTFSLVAALSLHISTSWVNYLYVLCLQRSAELTFVGCRSISHVLVASRNCNNVHHAVHRAPGSNVFGRALMRERAQHPPHQSPINLKLWQVEGDLVKLNFLWAFRNSITSNWILTYRWHDCMIRWQQTLVWSWASNSAATSISTFRPLQFGDRLCSFQWIWSKWAQTKLILISFGLFVGRMDTGKSRQWFFFVFVVCEREKNGKIKMLIDYFVNSLGILLSVFVLQSDFNLLTAVRMQNKATPSRFSSHCAAFAHAVECWNWC